MSYRIGILNTTESTRTGGGFHYIMTLIRGLMNERDLHQVIFYDDPRFVDHCPSSSQISLVQLKWSESRKVKIGRRLSTLLGFRAGSLGRYQIIAKENIDLLISFDSIVGFHIGIPFVTFIGDVMYKYYPGLPEYTFRTRVIRNLTAKMLIRHAQFIVLDSEESKKDVVRFFSADPGRLVTIPLSAPPHIYEHRSRAAAVDNEFLNRHGVPGRFMLYPAQFWAHKNHANVVKALSLVKQKYGIEIPMVFVGSAWDSYEPVQNLLTELDMKHQVRCLGYLKENELVFLYQKSTAVVFASYADYTGIPIVEAMILGKPIACSKVFSLPEQAGDAAVYFDPFDVHDIAETLYRLWSDEGLRNQLSEKGRKRAEIFSPERFSSEWIRLIRRTLNQSPHNYFDMSL